MSPLPLGMIVESLVAVLLVLTIVYCIVLNRRLKMFRANEEDLRATISELVTATEIAERAIIGLKATASDCDKTLAHRLRQAEKFNADLAEQLDAGESLMNRIARITEAGRVSEPAGRFGELGRVRRGQAA